MASSIDITPENFVRAVETLYHDQDATRKKFASEWLLGVQSSLYAWSLADQLIRMNQNSEVTCLSAQILRHKIQHNFDELPVEHCKPLCDSLLDHLSRVDLTRNTKVRVQLAVATADLALQYVGWEKPVEDVVEKLTTTNEHLLTLLAFLTALPEEVDTSTIRIGENRRRFCREKYSNYGQQIHDILISILQVNPTPDETLFIGILKCFASWISIEAFNDILLLSSPLVKSILDILKSANCSKDVHKSACDCLCNILELCEEYQKYWSLIVYLKKEINGHLIEPYFQSVKDENLDKAQNYTRIYTNLIESIVDCLVDGRHSELSDLSCLRLIIYPLKHTDYEIVQSTFNTWYRLSELIQTINDDNLIDKIKPYLEQMLNILCEQCELDSDHLGVPPETDEKTSSNSDLAEFRYRVECLIKDTIFIIGSVNCFQHMFRKLEKSVSLSWEKSEAPLYIMSCVASCLPSDENEFVPNLINILVSTPTNIGIVHTAVKYTGVRLLAQLNEWISKNDQKYLKSVLGYLLSLLSDNDLRFVSADSILLICQQCKKQLVNDLEQIIRATIWLDQMENGSPSAQCLLKASSKLISRLTSKDDIQKYIQILFDQQINCLTQILSNQSDSNFSSISKRLDCLTAIFRTFDFQSINIEAEFCVNLVQKLYPYIELIIVRYRSSSKLSECWSRTIRFIIRSMSSYAKSFFQPIVTLIITSYDEVAHSCFLYLISVIVDEYGNDRDLKSAIISMSEHLTGKTFSILANSNGFQQNPDLADDFYRLSSRLLQRCSFEYLQSNQIDKIIEQIVSNCNLEHRDAFASMMAFVQTLAKLTTNHKKDKHVQHSTEIRQLAMNLCEKYFPNLLTGLLRAILIDRVPSAIRLLMSEFISDLKIFMPNKFSLWLNQSLNQIPRTTKNGLVEIVTQQQQQQFYQILTQNDTQPSTIEDELERYARLYR